MQPKILFGSVYPCCFSEDPQVLEINNTPDTVAFFCWLSRFVLKNSAAQAGGNGGCLDFASSLRRLVFTVKGSNDCVLRYCMLSFSMPKHWPFLKLKNSCMKRIWQEFWFPLSQLLVPIKQGFTSWPGIRCETPDAKQIFDRRSNTSQFSESYVWI